MLDSSRQDSAGQQQRLDQLTTSCQQQQRQLDQQLAAQQRLQQQLQDAEQERRRLQRQVSQTEQAAAANVSGHGDSDYDGDGGGGGGGSGEGLISALASRLNHRRPAAKCSWRGGTALVSATNIPGSDRRPGRTK